MDFEIINNILLKYCGTDPKVDVPEGVEVIGESAFYGNRELKSVTIPEGVKSIAGWAFAECSDLTSVIIPSTVKSIGEWAFSECSALPEITIPDGVKSIGEHAFFNCNSLHSVVIPENLTEIGEEAFQRCEGLADEKGFVIINGLLFNYFGSDNDVIIPDGVTRIDREAFRGCSSLKKVSMPDSITSIGRDAFGYCSGLKDISISQGVTAILPKTFEVCQSLESVIIPDSVSSIGEHAFDKCVSLARITIPESVTSIGDVAFGGCVKLNSLAIPASVTSLGDQAFSRCKGLTCLDISGDAVILTKDVFGWYEDLPKGLVPEIEQLYPHMSDGALKQYVLNEKVWRELSDDLKIKIFMTRQGKSLVSAYGSMIEPVIVKPLGEAVMKSLDVEKPGAKDCNTAATFMTLFYKDAEVSVLKEIYEKLKSSKTGAKAVKTVEDNIELMEKLGSEVKADETLPLPELKIMEKLIAEKKSEKGFENELKDFYNLTYKDLPELKASDGRTTANYVLAWLLMAHEELQKGYGRPEVVVSYENPGISSEAAEITDLLDRNSLQAALKELADKFLVQYQNTNKKFLSYPICRYADDTVMEGLTKRAPKWRTSVSGNDAPPLIQLRDAVMYSDSRWAMLFAERYHELNKYAGVRGTDEDTIRDLYLSDVGLDDNGGKEYDLGTQTVTARLQKDLSFLIELPDGKTAKSLPKKGSDPEKYSEANEDFSEMKKTVKRILKSRGNILFEDFLSGRERSGKDWKEVYLHNPLLREAASTVVWSQGGKTFTLKDKDAITSDGNSLEIKDNPVSVAHPMDMESDDILAWQHYFTKSGLKQPFAQVWEPVRNPDAITEDRYKGCMIPFYRFSGQAKHGIHVTDEDFHDYIAIDIDGCDTDIQRIDYYSHEIHMDDRFEVKKFAFRNYTRGVNHIVVYLDRVTVWDRVRNDDITVMDMMQDFTLAQVTEFIDAAQEAGAANVLAALLEYKNANYSGFDPIDEFTLEW